jgi:hypothetical protein
MATRMMARGWQWLPSHHNPKAHGHRDMNTTHNDKWEAAGGQEERGHPIHHWGWGVGFFSLLFPITNVFFSVFVDLSDGRMGWWWWWGTTTGWLQWDDNNDAMGGWGWGHAGDKEDRNKRYFLKLYSQPLPHDTGGANFYY